MPKKIIWVDIFIILYLFIILIWLYIRNFELYNIIDTLTFMILLNKCSRRPTEV